MLVRRIIAVGVVVLLATPVLSSSPATSRPADTEPSVTALFPPGDDCIKAIVTELNAATKSILVQAYVLTSDKIGDALISARHRGVDVRVLLDSGRANTRGSEADRLIEHKATLRVDDLHHYAHSKIMIVDRLVVITGSFNFSAQAQEDNAENLLIIKGHPEVVRRFEQNWKSHAKHSSPFNSKNKAAEVATEAENKTAASPNPKPAGQEEQGTVYVTKSGKRYHRKECQFAQSGAEAVTRDEAVKKGKSPCRRCKPD